MPEPWRPAEVVDRYRSLLMAVGSVADELDGVTLTSHWPLVGTAPRRVLVIGQAVFGWTLSWHASRLSTPAGVDEILDETQLACYERQNPMDWIVENRVRASPFWRTVRLTMEGLHPQTGPAAELVDAIARALDPDLTLVLAGTFWWPSPSGWR